MGTWLPEQAEGATAFDAVFGLRPDLFDAFRSFAEVFDTHRLVDPVVLELCRLRCAQLLGCRSELVMRSPAAVDAGLTEADVAALTQWPTSDRFTDAQRACLALAEQFVLDPHGVTPAQRAAVAEHFGEAGLVALVEALAIFDGFTRFRTILGIGDEGG